MLSNRHHTGQAGSAHPLIVVVCLMMVGLFATSYKVVSDHNAGKARVPDSSAVTQRGQQEIQPKPAVGPVSWSFEGGVWQASGTPPACPAPMFAYSPVDTTKLSAVLPPGQYRDGVYKTSASLTFAAAGSSPVAVKLPFDAHLSGYSKYLEAGKPQYRLVFEHACGIQVAFDHLAALPASVAGVVTSLQSQKPAFKAGAQIATATTEMDFGVYDLRQRNQISHNATWASLHDNDVQQAYYGVCGLSWLPSPHAKNAQNLLTKLTTDSQGASDYCDDAPGGSTLQYDDGKASAG